MLTVQTGPAGAPPGTRTRRVLVAPVTVTPSKPLGPSHLKGLFWTDVMVRATAHLAHVTYRYSPTTYHLTEQTLAFWEYLDRTLGDVDYSAMSEEDIGEHYVGFRAEGHTASTAALRPYAHAVELHGWTHPAGARVLELWRDQYTALGLHDPGLTAHQPPAMGLDEVIDRLGASGMCLDLRRHGGPVYLDATRHGLPLRQIAAADGRPNYVACALRELVPLSQGHDEVVLLYDREIEPDYHLLQVVLSDLGHTVHRVPLGRVPIDGHIRSARHGGWRDTSARALLDAVGAEVDADAVRLGMRLYFIAVLGPGQQQSFRLDLLRQCLHRAERLLASVRAVDPAPVAEVLERHRRHHVYVDPYRLTSSLLARYRPAPGPELLSAVYL
ncbi:hypothetical protein GCM10022251_34590 [Phytohabitans flavus]|uniref:Uncharacterized protein n=1 Tax=Phytohabitans flavus TaxID=1076124 RepID=A0A6F8XMZ1_9ACTN|nr:hypothetical protein [Phytohabitans flavus]BCB75183.1 hypothetical protein Pflav_015930 [Phytohabitans flavus]